MLIINAEIFTLGKRDLRIDNGLIVDIAPELPRLKNSNVIDAEGGCLLPGLHDHHLHLMSLAASMRSVFCGPPKIHSPRQLIALLQRTQPSDDGWIRGMAYHDSIGPNIDRHWLDQYAPDCPIKIQHRSGAAWIFNTQGLEKLGLKTSGLHKLSPLLPDSAAVEFELVLPDGIERDFNGELTGRLFHMDQWLAERIPSTMPPLAAVSQMLARYGVTGVTDATPRNGPEEWNLILGAQQRGDLQQRVMMMGSDALNQKDTNKLLRGPLKVYLKEASLPEFTDLVNSIESAHQMDRAVAFHCVTYTELIYALSCLAAAKGAEVDWGDRIEHASITDQPSLVLLAERGVTVVTQPNFVSERGDQYLKQVDAADIDNLYRGKSFLNAGIPLAAGTDAPFGNPDPWKAMRAAVQRSTNSDLVLGADEALSPEQALSLFLGSASNPGGDRRLKIGGPADLCLLDKPWSQVRENMDSERVRATICCGRLIYELDAD
jgi:predicted amidohydrolase YtcJ